MIRLASEFRAQQLASTVCIVGGGPAGITIALELEAAGVSTLLLESGLYSPEPWSLDQAAGETVGELLFFDGKQIGLEHARLRQLGGSTGHWSGLCRPLEPMDFERTPRGVTGWPLRFHDLEPWYRLAQKTCELGPFEYGPEFWFGRDGQSPLLDNGRWNTVVYQFSPPTRFGVKYREALAESSSVEVMLGVTALEILSTPDGRHVSGLTAATADGRRFQIDAEVVVLATGGIDVARLLLVSTSARPEGVGNRFDLVGRYFMDHPHVPIGHAFFTAPVDRLALHRLEPRPAPEGGPSKVWAGWAPTASLLSTGDIPRAAVTFSTSPRLPRGDQTVERAVGNLLRLSPEARPVELIARVECEPRLDRRVGLSKTKDGLGVPRARLHWRFTREQAAGVRRLAQSFAWELVGTGLGRFRHASTLAAEVGNHHMGTARMADGPANGVVDRDCRVHGVDNLYVTGSAVFPTSGYANPTLTIVALAHRLGRSLGELLGSRRPAAG